MMKIKRSGTSRTFWKKTGTYNLELVELFGANRMYLNKIDLIFLIKIKY